MITSLPHQPPKRLLAVLLIACLTTTTAVSAQTPDAAAPAAPAAPLGRWITASGNLEIEVAPCAPKPPAQARVPGLCGTVTRVMANQSMSQSGEDMKPVDTRPAMGMEILSGFMPDADGTQWQGHIYNRENGRTYACAMSLDGHGGLVLRPYIGLPLFGKTQVWRRP